MNSKYAKGTAHQRVLSLQLLRRMVTSLGLITEKRTVSVYLLPPI